jgi:hypothetical protein
MAAAESGRLILVCLTHAPVHANLMRAYRTAYLRRRPDTDCIWLAPQSFADSVPDVDRHVPVGAGRRDRGAGLDQLRQVLQLDADAVAGGPLVPARTHVFVQSTHPLNSLLIFRLRRALGQIDVHYYLHEPGTLRLKLARGDGLALSVAVTVSHHLDLRAANRFYVSNAAARERAMSSYRIPGLESRCDLLPLPFPDLVPDWSPPLANTAPHLLMLGRADERRCLDVFLGLARLAARERPTWRFTILSSSPVAIDDSLNQLPNLQLQAGQAYSDAQMSAALRAATHVFNLFRITYTQSGVTPVALMHGVPVIAATWERSPELESLGCIYVDDIPQPDRLLDIIGLAPKVKPQGLRAFYLRHHDAAQVSLPESALNE